MRAPRRLLSPSPRGRPTPSPQRRPPPTRAMHLSRVIAPPVALSLPMNRPRPAHTATRAHHRVPLATRIPMYNPSSHTGVIFDIRLGNDFLRRRFMQNPLRNTSPRSSNTAKYSADHGSIGRSPVFVRPPLMLQPTLQGPSLMSDRLDGLSSIPWLPLDPRGASRCLFTNRPHRRSERRHFVCERVHNRFTNGLENHVTASPHLPQESVDPPRRDLVGNALSRRDSRMVTPTPPSLAGIPPTIDTSGIPSSNPLWACLRHSLP